MRKTEEDQGAKLVRAMTGVLLGGGLALVVCLVFLLICSVGISGGWVEEDLMYQLSVVGCVILCVFSFCKQYTFCIITFRIACPLLTRPLGACQQRNPDLFSTLLLFGPGP